MRSIPARSSGGYWEGAFDDPAVAAEAGAVLRPASRDQRPDAAPPDEATVLVVVVAAIGDHTVGPLARSTEAAAYRWHPVEQLE
jgi:hypothetical protein